MKCMIVDELSMDIYIRSLFLEMILIQYLMIEIDDLLYKNDSIDFLLLLDQWNE